MGLLPLPRNIANIPLVRNSTQTPVTTVDVISMLAGFCRHVVGRTLTNVFHCDSAEIRFVGKRVIIQTFS